LKSQLFRLFAGILCLSAALSFGLHDSTVAAAPATASHSARTTKPAFAPLRIDLAAAAAEGVRTDVIRIALGAVACATASGDIERPSTLTLIDYSKPSLEPRLWVFDMETGKLLFKELVAHGKNTGENMATRFSDDMDSRQSSLGLFVTADTYVGNNGYSLRLDGLEPGFNAHARERAIVMHGAPYVDARVAASNGRLGRSWGCPALREAVAHKVIDTIRGGGVIFSYYPDPTWLHASRFLNGCGAPATTLATN
jgi:hypothetical protein